MTPTQIAVAIAVGVGPSALLLALFGCLVWLDRPSRVTRQQPPAVTVPDPALDANDRAALQMMSSATFAPDSQVTLPSGRVVTGTDIARLTMLPGEVRINDKVKVHRECLDARCDGLKMCNHCGPAMARSATEVPW